MQVFNSGVIDIAYHDVGDGQPILLIHGFGSNVGLNWEITGWIKTLTEASRRVVAMDVRGHGQSGKLYDPEDYRPANMAADAADLLDHLSLSGVDVMGYSMGARIAAYLTLARPDMVRSLVFGGMAMGLVEGIGGEEEIVAGLEAPSLADVVGERPRSYRKFAEQTNSDLRALAACMRAQRELLAISALASIEAPVLIAVGTEDTVAGSAVELARLMPNARSVDIPGRDHLRATGDEIYKAAVLDFLP